MRRLKKLLHLHSISFLAVAEPFIFPNKQPEIMSQLGFNFMAANVNDKLWIFSRGTLQFSVIQSTTQLLHLSCLPGDGMSLWMVTFIYAKGTRRERMELWADLAKITASTQGAPWFLGGDFNCVVSMDEYQGGGCPDLSSMEDFRQCISDCDLMEVPYTGSKFT